MLDRSKPEEFGANSWLVEEIYARFREIPNPVGAMRKVYFSAATPSGNPQGAKT